MGFYRAILEALELRQLLSSTPTFTVTFDDNGGLYSDYYSRVRTTILAAANDWGQYIDSSAKIDLRVEFDATLLPPILASATFDSRVFFRQESGYEVQIGNVAAELRTGVDQNGSQPDAEIFIRPGALDEFFFDSSAGRTTTVPSDKIDARSVLLHELGHALGFFGDGDGPDDSPAGDRLAYDQYVTLSGGELYFTGPNAEAVYGGPVPLSHDDSSHVGNDDGPGQDIADDLMAPAIGDGDKRFISQVDLGILADSGVPLKETLIPVVQVADISTNRTAGGTADFVVTLSKASSQTVSVPVRTINGTALAGRDYVAMSQTLTFAPGETSKTVSVSLMAGSKFDKDKTFLLNLGLPTNAALLRGQATATLHNPMTAADAKHPVSFTDATGNTLTFSLRGPGTLTVNRDTAGNLDTLSITGSTAATTLTIKSKRPSVLHGITAPGGLGGIIATNTSFDGTLSLAGTTQVKFLDLLTGSSLTFTSASKQLTFLARNLTDTAITAAGAIRSFSIQAWKDTDDVIDLLQAASLGTVTIKGEMQGDIDDAGALAKLTAGTLRNSTLHTGGSVTNITLGASYSSNLFVATTLFPESTADFSSTKAVLKNFTIRGKGIFSDTRVAAPSITKALLGSVRVSNSDAIFGIAADSVALLTAATPQSPKLKQTKLTAPQTLTEDDFVVRVL